MSLSNAPTSEEIHINICFKYWKFLCFLFPKTFKSEKEACNFYEDFCKRAKELNEKEEFYKLPFEFYVNCKIDMLSGLVLSWNTYNNRPQSNFMFALLDYSNIEDLGLQNEILRIYEENYEHLKSLGMVNRFSSGGLIIFNHFVMNAFTGLFKNSHYCLDFCSDDNIWEQKKENFYLPIDRIIVDLRKIATNIESLSNKIDETEKVLEDKYDKYNCKFNLKDFKVEMNTDMFQVSVKSEYYFPARDDNFPLEYPNLPYKYINLR